MRSVRCFFVATILSITAAPAGSVSPIPTSMLTAVAGEHFAAISNTAAATSLTYRNPHTLVDDICMRCQISWGRMFTGTDRDAQKHRHTRPYDYW
jgi:hypothetical protein